MLVTQAHRNIGSCYYLGQRGRAARSLGGGGSSARVAVAVGSRVVGSQRLVLGGVVEDNPPYSTPWRECIVGMPYRSGWGAQLCRRGVHNPL